MRATLLENAPDSMLRIDLAPGETLGLADGSLLSHNGGALRLGPLFSPASLRPALGLRLLARALVLGRRPLPFWRLEAPRAMSLLLGAPWPGELRRLRLAEWPRLHLSPEALLAFDADCLLRPVSLGASRRRPRLSFAPRFLQASGTGELWAMSLGAWEELAIDGEAQFAARAVLGYAGELTATLEPLARCAGALGKPSGDGWLLLRGRGRVFLGSCHRDEWAAQLLAPPEALGLAARFK